jgi:3-hydroxyanthranilate 3,4-dioxygenase
MLAQPLDFAAFLAKHRADLKPPVANKCIYDGNFIVMVVGGPNARTDFHIDEGAEWFYQLEGVLTLIVQEAGEPRSIEVKAGEMFLLPPLVPHSPQRSAGSVGIVVERKRLAGELDGLQWYCQSCNHLLYDERFVLNNIETDFGAVFDRFYSSKQHRTCSRCGALHPAPARYSDA